MAAATSPLDNIVVVLQRPQRLVNIAGVVRAMKNMGLSQLRLVQPAEYEPYHIEGVAHRSADLLEATRIYEQLDYALADLTYIVGTTARPRDVLPRVAAPREIAPELLARAVDGPVGLLFGPEDNGLTNSDLDRCHNIISIPTVASYTSLNLAQAVLIIAYELRLVEQATPTLASTRRASLASGEQLADLFEAIERALWSIEFFKSHRVTGIMRTMRSLIHRAEPDVREASLLKAMAMETIHFMKRKGITPAEPSTEDQESGTM